MVFKGQHLLKEPNLTELKKIPFIIITLQMGTVH